MEGKPYRPNMSPYVRRIFTPEEIAGQEEARRIHGERVQKARAFFENFRPIFPNGEEAEPVVDRQTLVAFLTWGHPLYVTPSGIYGYVYVNTDEETYKIKLVGEEHTRSSLVKLAKFKSNNQS